MHLQFNLKRPKGRNGVGNPGLDARMWMCWIWLGQRAFTSFSERDNEALGSAEDAERGAFAA
jgi:hypothetical protein